MLAPSEEVYIWEGLLQKVRKLLGNVDSGRTDAKTEYDEPTPSFNLLEDMLDDVRAMIEGRLQELDPSYSERTAWGSKAQAQARKLLLYGVNFQAMRGVPYDETDEVLVYLEEHGLVSMNYEATREALAEYRRAKVNEELRVKGA